MRPNDTPATRVNQRSGALSGLAISLALLLGSGLGSRAQTPNPSAAALQAHSAITAYEGPATCVACHDSQARQMFGSLHYQEMADPLAVPNIDEPAGKGSNGARVLNSYCGTPSTSSRATCAMCHVGNGRKPSPQLTTDQLNNIDCLICHQDAYKRVPAPPYEAVTMPGPNGTTHTIQAVVEDETGFQFVPDVAKMTMPILEAARTVHPPTRASCLRCHATAGGSDGGKRGDISTVTINPPATSDIHMSPQGANLSCSACHDAGNHRVAGRGVDLRPSDSSQSADCAVCHTSRPHGDYLNRDASRSRDAHAQRIACQTCHIPAYAKDKSTEMERDWERAVFSMAACRGQGGWVPEDVRAGNVLPVYQWFDGTSLANVLGQAPVQKPGGEYVLALPNGSVQSTGARLYPMKPHRSNSARLDSTGELIPHSTYTYFTSGNFAAAVAEGQRQSGLTGPYTVVPVQEYQTINHGVESKSSALQCGACHAQYSSGGPVRMNLQKDLGYGLKATSTPLCSQCHSAKTSPGFAYMHNKHVVDKGYDCSACHEFSRPERQLGTGRAIRPAAPNGPVATALSATSTRLVWADNSSSEQGFRIERSTDGASFIEVGTVAANITSASDSGLTPGKAYFYRVRAYNASGTSAYSQVGRATPGAVPISSPPPAPEGLSATAGQQSVALTWNRVGEASAYIVKRSTTIGGSFSAIASGVTTSAFTDTGLNGGTTYYYVVSAVNSSGEGPDSAAVSATPVAPPPSAPTQVAARGFDRAGIQVSWVPSISPNIVENRIYRSASSTGVFSLVGRVSGAVPTYSDTGLKRGAIYYYRVTAVNSSGRESAPSATVSARAGRTR